MDFKFHIKNYIKKITHILDYIILLPLILSIPSFYLFARIGGKRLKKCRETLKAFGIYPISNHYYQPLFKDSSLKYPLSKVRNLPLINFREKEQVLLLEKLIYSNELIELKLREKKSSILDFNIDNGSFESGDAEFLYQIIRHFKPGKIIEIGSGESTKISQKALKTNFLESGTKCEHICIEPYENNYLEELDINLKRILVEDCDLKIFNSLGNNDLLFIDSSHMIRPQGDVLKEYLEIIPILKSGVIIHIHDIFTPRDYKDIWIKEDVIFWNEQYLLECLLSNPRYEIIAGLNLLKNNHFKKLKKVCPYLDIKREPTSFYFRVK